MRNSEIEREAAKMLCHYLGQAADEKGISRENLAETLDVDVGVLDGYLTGENLPSLLEFVSLSHKIGLFLFVVEKNDGSPLADQMKSRWGWSKN
jgi:ribosome-binding protein aMBF1 (putative translation factor)